MNRARLAGIAQVSLRQLERYLASDFMIPPRAWLREQRMQIACDLLAKAPSVKDVAYALGFRHSSHFCREFKRSYGMTPSQFVRRRTIQNAGGGSF
jgi:AraC-like DNA-binding protein